MLIFVGHYHILHNLLYVFIGSFHYAIYLRPVWRRIMMLDFELSAKLIDHNMVEVSHIFDDDPFGDTIAEDEVMFDEFGYGIIYD